MRYINALPLAFRYRSKRHQLGDELVIQSRPAHSLWKGRVCQVGLFPSRKQCCACFITVLSISNIIYSADVLLGGRHCQVIQVTIKWWVSPRAEISARLLKQILRKPSCRLHGEGFSPGRNSARAENPSPVWEYRARIFSPAKRAEKSM